MKLYKGQMAGGEVLLTVHDDDTHQVAWRGADWETWSEPTTLLAVQS